MSGEGSRRQVLQLISDRTGLSFGGSRGARMAALVREALEDPAVTPAAVVGRSVGGDDPLRGLYDELTVQESFFFREHHALAGVLEQVVSEGPERLRVWSAGCARGEEPYTLAILLQELGAPAHEVLATDLSPAAIEAARGATYGPWALRGLDHDGLASRFEAGEEGFRVAARFRENVSFLQHNVLEALPPGTGPFEVAVCRNVLIYLTPDGVDRAARALVEALVPGGRLLLGAADPPLDHVPGLQRLDTGPGPVYRRIAGLAEPEGAVRRQQAVRPRTRRMPGPAAVPARSRGSARPPAAQPAATAASGPDPAPSSSLRLSSFREQLRAQVEEGRPERSLATVTAALAEFPEDSTIRELHAAVLLAAGRHQAALVAARQAVYLDPGSPSARRLLRQVRQLLDPESRDASPVTTSARSSGDVGIRPW